MKILAFDQATNCGYCVMDNGKLIDYGSVNFEEKTSKKTRDELKCQMHYDESVDLFLWAKKTSRIKKFIIQKYSDVNPDWVVFETVQDNHNHDVHTKLAGLLNLLIEEFICRGCNLMVYPISAWKSQAGIDLKKTNEDGKKVNTKREEHKAQAISLVKEKFGIEVDTDVADAICIAMAVNGIKG